MKLTSVLLPAARIIFPPCTKSPLHFTPPLNATPLHRSWRPPTAQVKGSNDANILAHRRKADTAILQAKSLSAHDEYDEAREAIDVAVAAYEAVKLMDKEGDGRRVPPLQV